MCYSSFVLQNTTTSQKVTGDKEKYKNQAYFDIVSKELFDKSDDDGIRN